VAADRGLIGGVFMRTKRTIFISISVSILSLTLAFAQSRTIRPSGTTLDDKLISLDFPQGSLADYVQAVIEARKGKATIIVDSELEEVQVPAARLRTVTLLQALEWIPKTAGARQQGLALQTTLAQAVHEEDSSVFLFTTAPTVARPGSTADDQVRTFALSWSSDPAPNGRNPELLKTAVQDALSTQGLSAKQPIRYNPQTGVLTIRGTSRDVNIASQVMNELRQAQQQATIIQELQTQLEDLKAEISKLKEAGRSSVETQR
jgi:hypothetical protein